MAPNYIRWFEEIGTGDVASIGGKNGSLGEMVRKLGSRGIKVPTGFCHYRRRLLAFHQDESPRSPDGYANRLAPSMPARMRSMASGGSTQRPTFTHLPFSRSL